jgi:glycosyltransferase involved in cell wall biosynthesis
MAKISIITVTFNCQGSIEATINSILTQHFSNFELIIIDGASTDGTLNVINKYKNRIKCIVSEPDNGIFDAMNKGIERANGDFVLFMNSGDTFVNNDVLSLINFDKEYGVIYGNMVINVRNKKLECKPEPFFKSKDYIKTMGICHQCIFVRTDLAKRYKFSPEFKIAADFNMIFQIWKKGYKFKYVDVPIANYDTTGFSAQNYHKQLKEICRIWGIENKFATKLVLLYLTSKATLKCKIKKILYK